MLNMGDPARHADDLLAAVVALTPRAQGARTNLADLNWMHRRSKAEMQQI